MLARDLAIALDPAEVLSAMRLKLDPGRRGSSAARLRASFSTAAGPAELGFCSAVLAKDPDGHPLQLVGG